jgi:hypothetical protein
MILLMEINDLEGEVVSFGHHLAYKDVVLGGAGGFLHLLIGAYIYIEKVGAVSLLAQQMHHYTTVHSTGEQHGYLQIRIHFHSF